MRGNDIRSLNDGLGRELRVIFKIEREAQLLLRHSERGGTPRVESPTAEKYSP